MEYYTYKECKEYLSKLKIRSSYDFYIKVGQKSFNQRVNKRPYEYYKYRKRNDWVSWSDFLSIDIHNTESKYLKFSDAIEYTSKLGLKNQKEWIRWCKENDISKMGIPSNPHLIYKNSGWESMSKWLGNESYHNITNIKYASYVDCKNYIKFNFPEIKNKSLWVKFNKSKLPINIPKRPDYIYKKSGDWINWESFLDSTISPRSKSKLFLEFDKARELVRSLDLKQECEYYSYVEENRIDYLPKRPSYVYKPNWKGFIDFLGCETNKKSYGEKKILEYLSMNKIEFIREKEFKTCKNVKNLKFDFYLPNYNICIEYDGELHYKESEFFGGRETLNRIVKNDEIKNNWCINNSIKIFRIPYTKKGKINKILDEILLNI